MSNRNYIRFKRWFYKDNVQNHFHAFWRVWLSVMIVDGVAQLMAIYNGDLSTAAFTALATASVNAVVKAIFQIILPEVFTLKTATTGNVSVQMTKAMDSVTVKKP